MSFSDIVRLKRLEDVLEKYWNDHRMDHTVEYLITSEFDSPFDFFQVFGDFWEERGWQRIGHQLEDLFSRLNDFLSERGLQNPDIVLGLMKLDYFLGHKYKPRKVWWEERMSKDRRSGYFKALAEGKFHLPFNYSLDDRELQKFAMVEEIPFTLTEGIELQPGSSLLVVLYQQEENERPVYCSIPLSVKGDAVPTN
ncbi:hypothetical protein D3C78_1249740 [compost metagenome]